MFAGFIAVIVVLLIIVGVISENSGGRSDAGIEQTRVMKVYTEILRLKNKLPIYKAFTQIGDYDSLSTWDVSDQGIFDSYLFTTIREEGDGEGGVNPEIADLSIDTSLEGTAEEVLVEAGDNIIRSPSLYGVYYTVDVNPDNPSQYFVNVLTSNDVNDATKRMLEKLKYKITSVAVEVYNTDSTSDGAFKIKFD